MAKFKTRARAIDMLGRQQIAGIPTAISEIFKNAHDAYAQYVECDYFRADDLIVIRDDGIGMTEDEFLNRWLAIGTESKLAAGVGLSPPPKPSGQPDRPILGEKGIGRLAIAAIGPQVLILTRARRGNEQHDTVTCFINWGIFESPGINLEEIDIPVIPYKGGELPSREDVLTLVDLFRDNIKALGNRILPELAERINKQLGTFDVDPRTLDAYLSQISEPTLTGKGQGTHFLILPTDESLAADIAGDRDINSAPPLIKTLIGFSNTMSGKATPRIKTSFRDHNTPEAFADLISPTQFFTPAEFQTADHHFQGKFDEYGQFSGRVTIYKNDPVKHTVPWTEGKGARTECGSFKLNLAYVQGELRESLLPRDDYVRITNKLNKIGGLYIYRDGIRVLPYGNSDYDFLELEQRRSRNAKWYYFSYRRMFGYVEINGIDNKELTEKAGREGFRENKAYRQFKAILKNFFLQIAADFFRESGEHSDTYYESRTELQRQEAVRRAREQKAKEERRQFSNTLNEFFFQIQSGAPQKESEHLLANVKENLRAVTNIDEPLRASAALVELEASARSSIETLRERYRVTKPRGVGLTTRLRRDWELCAREAGKLEVEVFQPTQQQLDALITEAASRPQSTASPQKRVERALRDRVKEARDTIGRESEETRQTLEDFRNTILRSIRDRADAVESVITEARTDLERLTASSKEEASILGEYYRLEAAINEATQKNQQSLENIRIQLQELTGAPDGPTDVVEALEEENLSLRERAESDLELAELGMAVSVIAHEFELTVRSIRTGILRLKGWADVNKELKDLYRKISSDFDHLDAYLQMFTPLQRRLQRKPTIIRGSEIARYLRDLFADRLRKEKVEIKSTNRFSEMGSKQYPSTFYPVFVNLVDNALYWLKDRPEPRIIKLDVVEGDAWIVSDNGPGVALRDKEAIFERGFTRKPGGRGMGLKISRDVLAREGYTLSLVDSAPGEGATFKIKPTPARQKGVR
jgi:C4-dicarboxylate-specific signal transduction histidine kinase